MYARCLFHTGAHALVDRLMPRRLTILAGHCVAAPSNSGLSRDMKIESEKLASFLEWFAARYEVTSVGDGFERLRGGGRKSLLALSMDDGYRDNVEHLLPILQRAGVPATIYLESRPLDERRVNWSHKYFWLLDRIAPEELIRRYTEVSRDETSNVLLRELAVRGTATSYRIKRVLKYDAPPAERSRVLDLLFAQERGDERALCDELYMTWDDARKLRDAGVELGGHTVGHEILSRLDADGSRAEIAGCRTALARELGLQSRSFAYPFGRRWDYDENARAAVRASGFAHAVTTHAGTNRADTDPLELKRLMIDEDAQLHLLVAEACGGFDLLRKFGIDLSE